jgi:hypothetical protein
MAHVAHDLNFPSAALKKRAEFLLALDITVS